MARSLISLGTNETVVPVSELRMTFKQRQLLHCSGHQELCKAIGAQASDYTVDQPAKLWNGRELRENLIVGLRKTCRKAVLSNGNGAIAQKVR